MGFISGFATSAFVDVLMRCSPRGLEGTAFMLSMSVVVIVFKAGDLFGTWLYKQGGFQVGVWLTVTAYSLIIVGLLWVPKYLLMTTDGGVVEQSA